MSNNFFNWLLNLTNVFSRSRQIGPSLFEALVQHTIYEIFVTDGCAEVFLTS